MAGRMLVQLSEADFEARFARLEALLLEHRTEAAPALLDRQGLARALSCSVKTLDRLRDDPNFPQLMLLDSPRFELGAVVTYLRARSACTSEGLRAIHGGKK